MTGPIDPRALRTFGAVCRAGSISRAARELGISRQTYGNIERGEFAPGDKTGTAEKLLAWLDKSEGERE